MKRLTTFVVLFISGALAMTASPSTAQLSPPKLLTLTPSGVDLATGNYVMTVNDLSVGTLSLQRSYLTGDTGGGGMSNQYFGVGWTHNFDIFARAEYIGGQAGSSVIIGRNAYHFSGIPPVPTYGDGDSIGTTLTSVSGAMVFTDRDGTVYRFLTGSSGGKISTITHPNGDTLTFAYVSGLPKTITSNRGYAPERCSSWTSTMIRATLKHQPGEQLDGLWL